MSSDKSSLSPAEPPKDRAVGRRRKVFFAGVLLLMTYGLIEGAAAVVYTVRYGSLFSFAAVSERQDHVKLTAVGDPAGSGGTAAPKKGIFGARVIHPYAGFATEPWRLKNDPACNSNKYGFYGAEDWLARPEGSANVVVSGGSLANHCLCSSPTELVRQLKTLARFKDKKIRLIGLTAGGYKQPQQAMALSYYLSLGGRADLAIVVDGFNEALFGSEAAPSQSHPAYPENWHNQVSFLKDRKQAKALGAAMALDDLRRRVLGAMAAVDFSVLANVLWRFIDGRLEQEANRQRAVAVAAGDKSKKAPRTFATHGPLEQIKDPQGASVQIWVESLRQMALLANANRFPLVAFLQPNQYITGSKPLTVEEVRDFTIMRQAYTKPLNKGYQRLRLQAAKLKISGFAFKDLSNIFRDNRETLYVDSCCHINAHGCDLLFQSVGDLLRAGIPGDLSPPKP